MLTSLSLRRSLPLLLGIFGLLFTVMLTAWHLPTRIEETLTGWRNHTSQHLALLQSSLSTISSDVFLLQKVAITLVSRGSRLPLFFRRRV